MDKKVTGIIAYLGLIGWLIAYLVGDKEGAKFHLNQALVLAIAGIIGSAIGVVPFVGDLVSAIVGVVVFVFAIMGIVAAAKDEEKELPIIGQIKILN